MKKYIQPRILMEGIIEDELIIATSPGVKSGDGVNNVYNANDVSYSRDRSGYSADYSLRDGWE